MEITFKPIIKGCKFLLTPEAAEYLENYKSLNSTECMAKKLNVSVGWVRDYYRKIGFKRFEMEYWTPDQNQFLKDNYQTIGDVELAEIFATKWAKNKGWSKKHIEKKRRYLKLKRTPVEMSEIRWGNYHKGFMHGSTRFIDKTIAQEGEVRMWRQQSGRLVPRIKINGCFEDWGKWKWLEVNGAITEGYNVVFVGDPSILTIENLALKSGQQMAENMYIKAKELQDSYVVGMLSRGNKELRSILIQSPELIDLKRNQLLLQREIKQKKS
jgi:hypothetical protein